MRAGPKPEFWWWDNPFVNIYITDCDLIVSERFAQITPFWSESVILVVFRTEPRVDLA